MRSISHNSQICWAILNHNGRVRDLQPRKALFPSCPKAKVTCTLSSFLQATIQAKTSRVKTRDRTPRRRNNQSPLMKITRTLLPRHPPRVNETVSHQRHEGIWNLNSRTIRRAHRPSLHQFSLKNPRLANSSSRYQRHLLQIRRDVSTCLRNKHSSHV